MDHKRSQDDHNTTNNKKEREWEKEIDNGIGQVLELDIFSSFKPHSNNYVNEHADKQMVTLVNLVWENKRVTFQHTYTHN